MKKPNTLSKAAINENLGRYYRSEIKTTGYDFDRIFPKSKIMEIREITRSKRLSFSEFEFSLLEMSHLYLQEQKRRHEIERFIDDSKSFEKIANLCDQLTNEISSLNSRQVNRLQNRFVYWAPTLPMASRDQSMQVKSTLGEKAVPPKNTLLFSAAIEAIRAINSSAMQLSEAGTKDLPDGSPLRAGHRPKLDHVQDLVRRIRALWVQTSSEKYARNFFKNSKNINEPISPAARFSTLIVHAIDSDLGPSQIESAMKTISAAKSRRNALGKS